MCHPHWRSLGFSISLGRVCLRIEDFGRPEPSHGCFVCCFRRWFWWLRELVKKWTFPFLKTSSSLENNSKSMKSMVQGNGHRFLAFGSMNRRPRSLKTVDAKEGPGAYQWASRGQGWPRSGKITGIMIRNRCFQWSWHNPHMEVNLKVHLGIVNYETASVIQHKTPRKLFSEVRTYMFIWRKAWRKVYFDEVAKPA